MEVAIYSDFERRKRGKRGKMPEVGREKPLQENERLCREKMVGEQEAQIDGNTSPIGENIVSVAERVLVKVLRVCANPRLVLCTYSEGGTERRVLVRVRSNVFFRRAMELEAVRAANETEPWSYEGRLPRFAGRW
jgi:hypothetical protein